MGQHPSLKSNRSQGRHRSVLKRAERIKKLKEQEKWTEEKNSIFGLPKVKHLRFKIKKEKAAPAAEEGAAVTAAKPGAEAKAGASAKPAEKEVKKDGKKESKKS